MAGAKKSKEKLFNYCQVVLDTVSIFFGLTTIITAVITFVDFSSNMSWAPLIFALSAGMNISLAIKSFMQREKTRGIFRVVQSVLLIIVCIAVFIATR